MLDMESRRKKETQKLFRYKDETRQCCFNRIMEKNQVEADSVCRSIGSSGRKEVSGGASSPIPGSKQGKS